MAFKFWLPATLKDLKFGIKVKVNKNGFEKDELYTVFTKDETTNMVYLQKEDEFRARWVNIKYLTVFKVK